LVLGYFGSVLVFTELIDFLVKVNTTKKYVDFKANIGDTTSNLDNNN